MRSYWVPDKPRPIKTNRVRIQKPDPTITNGLRNNSKGEVDPDSNGNPKVDLKPRLEEYIFNFAETMVNLEIWAIVIFVLKTNKNKDPVSCHHLAHMLHSDCFASKLITEPAEFDHRIQQAP